MNGFWQCHKPVLVQNQLFQFSTPEQIKKPHIIIIINMIYIGFINYVKLPVNCQFSPAKPLWNKLQIIICSHELNQVGQFSHTRWKPIKIDFVWVHIQLLQLRQLANGRLYITSNRGVGETRLVTSHQIYQCKLNDNTINVMKRYLLHMHESTFKAKQHLISATFLCFALWGNEGLTGRDVSWFLERLRVSSLVHWSMHSDSSDIWLLLRFSRLRLASEYKHSGTRVRSLQDRSTSTQKHTRFIINGATAVTDTDVCYTEHSNTPGSLPARLVRPSRVVGILFWVRWVFLKWRVWRATIAGNCLLRQSHTEFIRGKTDNTMRSSEMNVAFLLYRS